MEELLLGAVYGLGLGLVAGGTLSVMGPFSRGYDRGAECVVLLVALCALAVGGGALVVDSWPLVWLVVAAAGVGGAVFWLWDRGEATGNQADLTQPLSAAELRRPKTAEDCWLLVTGSQASGKTGLVERLVDETRRFDRVRLAAPPRSGVDGRMRVAELRLRTAGRERILRFWERAADEGSPPRPAIRDLDGVVVTIDPARVSDTARTFPAAMKVGPSAVDVNGQAVMLDASLAKAGATAIVWQVITKADLIRFSIDTALVKLVRPGRGWHEQLRGFNIAQRRELADCLGIDISERAAMQQGQGSPFLAYAGRGASGSDSFGGAPLLRAIIDTLLTDALWSRGGEHAR